jgi:polyisoprenoid-binding protein YceI
VELAKWRERKAEWMAADASQEESGTKMVREEEKKMTAVMPTTGSKTVWAIDPAHTDVEFAVRHMMLSNVKGHFSGLSGAIQFDENDLTNSSVEVEIDASTVNTREPNRDAHLKSADFFEVEKYPTITFKSTGIKKVNDKTYEVTGDLTIRDVTRPVVLETAYNGRNTSPWGTQVLSVSAETVINRKDYGLTYNVALETGGFVVGDKIKISIEVEAILQQEA